MGRALWFGAAVTKSLSKPYTAKVGITLFANRNGFQFGLCFLNWSYLPCRSNAFEPKRPNRRQLLIHSARRENCNAVVLQKPIIGLDMLLTKVNITEALETNRSLPLQFAITIKCDCIKGFSATHEKSEKDSSPQLCPLSINFAEHPAVPVIWIIEGTI